MLRILTCDPELLQKDLTRRNYIATGYNSGAGFAYSAQLVLQGAHVVGACRRVEAGKQTFTGLAGTSGLAELMKFNLDSLASVRRFVEAFTSKYEQLDGLINNAGIMHCPEGKTEGGDR